MTAAKTVYYFGIYLIAIGLALIVAPNLILSILGLPESAEVWPHITGVLVFNIGVLYYYMAGTNNTTFFALSAYLRASIIIWFAVFVWIGWGPPMLLGFGVVDLLGAIWTYMALKKE